MLARVQSFVLQGIDAIPCEIEVDIDESALNGSVTVGLPDAAVRESHERVRSAFANAGYRFPGGRLLINLAPADVRKEGPVYDLPIAVGVLIADGAISTRNGRALAHSGAKSAIASSERGRGNAHDFTENFPRLASEPPDFLDPRQCMIAGELALDGRIRPVRGVLAMTLLARSRGMRAVIVPSENATEAAVVEGIDVYGVETLAQVVAMLNGLIPAEPHPAVDVASLIENAPAEVDFAEVRGQEAVKRAITVSAAGGHNLLMLGPAGTGKTMMAKALPGVLPPLTCAEALEVTRIYSAAGRTDTARHGGLITARPVRTPHHTASAIAVIGGGAVPRPGEISLAHRGILFLDELPEFPRMVLDTLRQPLEDGRVTIARAHSAAVFPTRFMLVAAMNPTPKGDMPVDAGGQRAMERYLGRISRPLIDRIDIHVEAPAVPWKELSAKDPKRTGTSSAQMRERVLRSRDRQHRRQGEKLNSTLSGRELDVLAPMDEDAREMLGASITELGLSARAYDKIRRVGRTIADIEGSDRLTLAHIAEAVQYRLLDRMV